MNECMTKLFYRFMVDFHSSIYPIAVKKSSKISNATGLINK